MTQIKFHIFKCLLDFFFFFLKQTVIFCVLLHHHYSDLLSYLKHAWETCEHFNKSLGSSVWCVHSKLQHTEFCIKFGFGISFSYVLKLKVISGIIDCSTFRFLIYIFYYVFH